MADYIKQRDHVVLVDRRQELETILIDPDEISRTMIHLVWIR